MAQEISETRFAKVTFPVLSWLTLAIARVVFGLKFYDRDNVPSHGRVIIASNHVAAYDPLVVGCCVRRRIRFMAKRELLDAPLLGTLLAFLNVYPVERGGFSRQALVALETALTEDAPVLLFPEGTRQRHGKLGEPKLGVGMLAVRTGATVVPVYVTGTQTIFKAVLRIKPFRVVFGEPISAPTGVSGPERKDAYRKVAAQVMEEIGRLKSKLDG